MSNEEDEFVPAKPKQIFGEQPDGSYRVGPGSPPREGRWKPGQSIAMDHVAPLVIAGLAVALVGWAVVVLTSRNRSR